VEILDGIMPTEKSLEYLVCVVGIRTIATLFDHQLIKIPKCNDTLGFFNQFDFATILALQV
jgi:hypothetical protein